ncbi:MAG: lipid-A-disaccharide synthase [Deltaproteobacteria bacterium]|nr:lipid-A-disaccharide synthase [Candidatus Zymogenaceae bacterium]
MTESDTARILQAEKRVLIVSGEASGDTYGAELIKHIKSMKPGTEFFGVGGQKMRDAGLVALSRAEDVSVVGFVEIFKQLRPILKALSSLKRSVRELTPDLVILIDFPDFNFRIARAAKRAGVPVFYYVSPQVWAWRRGRVKTIKKNVDRMIVIFPFEVDFYREAGVSVEFYGHPIMDVIGEGNGDDRLFDRKRPQVALLPGSRHGEVERHMDVLLRAGRLIMEEIPGAKFRIPLAPTLTEDLISPYLERTPLPVEIVHGDFHRVVGASDVAIACSGTATLETALLGTPMVVYYRLNPMTYFLGRMLIQVDYISIINLIARESVVPELIQDDANPENIARETLRLLTDDAARGGMIEKLKDVKKAVGLPGASRRIAARVADFLYGENSFD